MHEIRIALLWSLGAWPLWLWMFLRIRHTTLRAAWLWSGAVLAGLTWFACDGGFRDAAAETLSTKAIFFALAVGTCAPTMAVFGAKRPQHRAWHWIVLSLWCVLALPAGESLVFQREMEIGAVRSWFLLTLIAWGLFNYLLTRFVFTAIVATVGQAWLLSSHLPIPIPPIPVFVREMPEIYRAILASVLFLLSGWWGQSGRRPGRSSPDWSAAWREFRDLYGAVWALRVMQRFNTTAESASWPIRLEWDGFHVKGTAASPAEGLPREAAREIHSLLRRFVSTTWLAERTSSG